MCTSLSLIPNTCMYVCMYFFSFVYVGRWRRAILSKQNCSISDAKLARSLSSSSSSKLDSFHIYMRVCLRNECRASRRAFFSLSLSLPLYEIRSAHTFTAPLFIRTYVCMYCMCVYTYACAGARLLECTSPPLAGLVLNTHRQLLPYISHQYITPPTEATRAAAPTSKDQPAL